MSIKNHVSENDKSIPLEKKRNWIVFRTYDVHSRNELSYLLNKGYMISSFISVGPEVEYILYIEWEE